MEIFSTLFLVRPKLLLSLWLFFISSCQFINPNYIDFTQDKNIATKSILCTISTDVAHLMFAFPCDVIEFIEFALDAFILWHKK